MHPDWILELMLGWVVLNHPLRSGGLEFWTYFIFMSMNFNDCKILTVKLPTSKSWNLRQVDGLIGIANNSLSSKVRIQDWGAESLIAFATGVHLDVSENSGTPKSSILTGFSIINHPFWGTPIFGNTHFFWVLYYSMGQLPAGNPQWQLLMFPSKSH